MAEGYEAYHVPQQSRRDKLRVLAQTHPSGCVDSSNNSSASSFHHGCDGLVPLYDPSLISSELITCSSLHQQNQSNPLGDNCGSNLNTSPSGAGGHHVKEVNLMGYVGGMMNASSSSSTSHHLYMDPQSSMQLSQHHSAASAGPIQDINGNPFLFTPQNLRVLDHHQSTLPGGEVVVYSKPEDLSAQAHEANNTTGQGLSLSLSSHHTQQHQSCLPLELNLQRYESSMFSGKVAGGYALPSNITGCSSGATAGGGDGGDLTSNDIARSSVPLGPWTGYASILKGSRFLKPAQQLLEELCDVGRGVYVDKNTADSSIMDPPPAEGLTGSGIIDVSQSCSGEGSDQRRKKSRLISLLNEVYKRYKQYYQEMQAVMASFESVAGLSNAAPFANLALKALSKHFRFLKNAITDQLHFTAKSCVNTSYSKDECQMLVNPDGGLYSQRPVHNSGFIEHQPVWRPQRGLPERAVTVLRAWLFDHFLHPYPTDTDKLMLAKQTGLSRNQVSNWFINARVRLWKPMVEEIHMLETRQAQKASQKEVQNANRPNDHLPTSNSRVSENPSTSNQGIQELPSKRTRNDLPNIPMASEGPLNLSYDNLSRHSHLDVNLNATGGIGPVSLSMAGGSSGVSLTLGLHQNNGIGLSEPFPLNAARRFGIDANGEGYVVGFEAQNGQFGRGVIGGQLLHDFVG